MDGKVLIGAGAAIAALLLLSKKTQAQDVYTCPYGDGLQFPTLLALQSHVESEHPGERIPISIQWNE